MFNAFAPGRVELLGNHTDYNEGFVLSFAVDRGVTFSGALRVDDKIILRSRELGETYEGNVAQIGRSEKHPWANYILGVVSQFQSRGISIPGFEADISSTLPIGAGLSSSAALETSTGYFLQRALGTTFSKLELARIGQAAEHGYVGVKCGLLDQISSIFSTENHVTFIDCRTFDVQNIPLPPEARFVIANSHAKHALVSGEYNERRESCEAAARALKIQALRDISLAQLEASSARLPSTPFKRAKHIVGENERVLDAVEALKHNKLELLGELMFASHISSQLNFENSCPELDALVSAAKKTSGCLGARLSGGGFGGATINLMRTGDESRIATALKSACEESECLQTKASGGARILD